MQRASAVQRSMGVLGTVADGLTGQQRQDYNPLEAYQSLMEWLG